MTNFSYLYDFVRTQVKLLGELGGVNGRARQLMIDALSNSLAILRDSVTVFFREGKTYDLAIDEDADIDGVPDATLSQQVVLNIRKVNKLFAEAEKLIEARTTNDPCENCNLSDCCQRAGWLCSPVGHDLSQMGALLTATDAIQMHAGKFLHGDICMYDVAELILDEVGVAKEYLHMIESFSIANCEDVSIAEMEVVAERRDLIEGEIDDLLVILRDRYDLELVVANLPVVVVDDEDYEV